MNTNKEQPQSERDKDAGLLGVMKVVVAVMYVSAAYIYLSATESAERVQMTHDVRTSAAGK
jgi:hypothetical protein